MDHDDALDALYELPLEEFTAARNSLAKRLRDEGVATTAAEVAALKKPNLAAWAINQVARSRRDDIRRLFEIRDELERGDGPQQIRRLGDERKSLVARLVRAAHESLESAGHSAAPATMDRISQSFLGGGDAEDRAAILAGRLTREVTSTGLEAFGMDALAAAEAAPGRPSAAARREVERLQRDADEAESEARRLGDEAKRLEEAARAAMEAAAEARRAAIKTRDRARRAEREL